MKNIKKTTNKKQNMKNNIVIQKILIDFYKNVMLFFIICYHFLE